MNSHTEQIQQPPPGHLPARRALADLAREMRACRRCPRMSSEGAVISWAGPRVARNLMFVAEAPGRQGAVKTGVPLSGDATGRNFDTLLAACGLSRAEVWVTNAALCWPEGPNGTNGRPSGEELAACSTFLQRQLELIDPLIVAPLGLTALDALRRICPLPRGRLRDLAGRPVAWGGRWVVPLFHPSPRVVNTVRDLEAQKRDFLALQRLAHETSKRRVSAL